MPEKKNPSIKDPELYEELRDDGASKEKAARISNAAAARGRKDVGRKGGKSGDYDDWTVDKLKARAKELGLRGTRPEGLLGQEEVRTHFDAAEPLTPKPITRRPAPAMATSEPGLRP